MAKDPKRHHHVPRAYLERFASDGLVRVRRRDGTSFETNPINVAVESGFYDISDGIGAKSSEVERLLARIEGPALGVIGDVDRSGRPPGEGTAGREALALFLALQMTRTTQHRERVLFPKRVADWADGREVTPEIVAAYLRTEHLGFEPDEGEVDGAYVFVSEHLKDTSVLTPTFGVEMMLQSADALTERILPLNWTVEVDPRHRFITSDAPVIPWRKPTRRDDYEGLGIDKAEELRFPLDPGKQLVLSRRRRRATVEVAIHRVRRANADLAGACHRFVVGRPGDGSPVDALHLDPWPPVVKFHVGPLTVVAPSGEEVRQPGEVVHLWVPRSSRVGRPKVR